MLSCMVIVVVIVCLFGLVLGFGWLDIVLLYFVFGCYWVLGSFGFFLFLVVVCWCCCGSGIGSCFFVIDGVGLWSNVLRMLVVNVWKFRFLFWYWSVLDWFGLLCWVIILLGWFNGWYFVLCVCVKLFGCRYWCVGLGLVVVGFGVLVLLVLWCFLFWWWICFVCRYVVVYVIWFCLWWVLLLLVVCFCWWCVVCG